MAEIIQFGEKRKDQSGSTAGAAALAFKTHKIDDWGNQELADLYRVKRLLEQAGVHVETDRGVSDEGDPWFVFCHPDGEVFVHLCRFDGQYLLDSTAIEAPLRGASFTDLINQFVDRAIERRAANIVSLRPGDGVYLHPAIMLTALIWTLFVASDELVGIAHGAEIDAAGPDFDALVGAHLTDVSDTQGAFGILQAALADQGDDPVVPKAAELERAHSDAGERDLAAQLNAGAGVNPISLSLSAIAVTFGMTSKSTFDFMQNAQAAQTEAEDISIPDLFDAHADAFEADEAQPMGETANVDAAVTSHSEGETTQRVIEAAVLEQLSAVFNVPENILLRTIITSGITTGSSEVVSAPVAGQSPALAAAYDLRARVNGDEKSSSSAKSTSNEDASGAVTNVQPLNQIGSAFEFAKDFNLKAFTLDEHEVFASFDLAKEQGKSWVTTALDKTEIEIDVTPEKDDGPLTSGTIRASTVTEYSEDAINFVKYLLSKTDTVEVIALKGKIVLVDVSAFDDVSDVSYLRNWAHEDVGIISTIGHLSDFEAFGLVIA